MPHLNKATLLLLMSLACFASAARAVERVPEQVDLCTIVANPAKYVNHRVSFEADVLADGMHGSVLISPKCDSGIFPDFDRAKAAGDAYGKAIFEGSPGTINKDIHAKFIGVVHIGTLSWPLCGQQHTCKILQVESMTDLRIVFKPGHEPIAAPDPSFHVKIAKPENPTPLPPR